MDKTLKEFDDAIIYMSERLAQEERDFHARTAGIRNQLDLLRRQKANLIASVVEPRVLIRINR